jgi:hypothetical protein
LGENGSRVKYQQIVKKNRTVNVRFFVSVSGY